MTALPSWLLCHRVTVERYAGSTAYDDTYDAPQTDVPALVAEQRRQTRDAEGRTTLSTAQVICAPDTDWPPQSRITLPSGRVTRVISAAPHTAPGLPVPESVEVMCE